MIMKPKLKITLPAIVAVFALLVVFIPSPRASALSAADWKPGRIIDDAVFFNKDAMNVQQIQNFLNAKVPVCDRNHPAYSASVAPPFTCLKEYNENTTTRENNIGRFNANGTPYQVPGGKSSAQIIWEAGQTYGINPQSLIVMLQKETSIVTDTWAAKWQYDRAMGYACPDSGPNNSANCDTSFYGFYNQVNSAAKQLKNYVNNPQYFNFKVGVTRNIQWHPNAACGSSPVYIETQATAALYNYTPYQPNSTALSNLYGGQTNGCSSYGNRNFWVYFNGWFGSTTDKFLIRTFDSGDLYYTDGQTKYRVTSMDIANEYGLGLSNVAIVSQDMLEALNTPQDNPYLTYVIKSTSDTDEDGGNIYLVSSGKRYLITSMDQFASFGFSVNQITKLQYSQFMRLPLSGNLSSFVKSYQSGFVYKIENGVRRSILDFETLNSVSQGNVVQDMNSYILDPIPLGTPIINIPVALKHTDGRVWLVINSKWHYIPSMSTYDCLGLGNMPNVTFSLAQTGIGDQGQVASCITQSATGQKYIMDNWRRIPANPAWGFSDFFIVPDEFQARMSEYSPSLNPIFRSAPNAPLYVFEGGKKRQIYSMSVFNQRNHTNNDLFTTTTDFISTIPSGSIILADGSIVRNNSDGRIYVISGNAKYYIPSMFVFTSYGYNTAPISNLAADDLASYPTVGTISSQVAYTPSATVFDSGIALQISPSLETAFGVSNLKEPTYPSAIASYSSARQATKYIKFGASGQLYIMENGLKRPVYSWDTFVSLGGSNANITGLSASAAQLYPTGPSL